MKLTRTYFYVRTGAILAALTSSSSAQLTWAPNDTFNTWDPSPAILAWVDAANIASPWDNTGLEQAIFNLDEVLTIVPIADAGVTVGDLQYTPTVPATDVLRLSAVTDNLGAITIRTGGATWNTGGGEIEFTANVVLDDPDTIDTDEGNGLNDTRLIIGTGDTLTLAGGGVFDTGERPFDADWTAAGATLDITDATILRGNSSSVGQFETVNLVDGSSYFHERNSDETYANNWVLGAGTTAFENRFARNYTLNGDITGDGGMLVQLMSNRQITLNGTNTFSGGLEVASASQVSANADSISSGDIILSGTSDTNGGVLRLLGGVDLGDRTITLNGTGGSLVNAGVNSLEGDIVGEGDFQVGNIAFPDNVNVITLSGTPLYEGNTNIFLGAISLGVDEAISSGVLTIGGGNNGGRASRLILNGMTQTVAGLAIDGNNTRQIVNLNSTTSDSTPGTLILNVADDPEADEEFFFGAALGVNSADDRGNINLVKNSDGAIGLGNVQIGGSVAVNTGTLRIGNSNGSFTVGEVTNDASLVIDENGSASSLTAGPGSDTTFNWEVSNFTGTAEGIAADPDNGIEGEAPGFTQFAVAGDLTLDAGSTFTIAVDDILTDGALANFTETDTSFVVATVGGANNIALSQITVDSSEFTSGTGTFTARLEGSNIVLDYIAGEVTDAYAAFASQFPNLVGGFGDDDDLDGLANGAEFFFFGSDPTVASSLPDPLCVVSSSGNGNLVFSHDRPLDFTGVTVTYEWSTTLEGDFTPSGVANGDTTVTITPGATTPSIAGYETVEVTTSSTPATLERVFVRVSLSQP